ncbi:MAG: hypothetical protein WAV09_00885 [Minisyncoccia bacterium]
MKKVTLPKNFGKTKTSRDHYADWVKNLPKGTMVKTYFVDGDLFTTVVVHPDITFAYTYEAKKKK